MIAARPRPGSPRVSAATRSATRRVSPAPRDATNASAPAASTAARMAAPVSSAGRAMFLHEPKPRDPERRDEVSEAPWHPHDEARELLILAARQPADRERIERIRIPKPPREGEQRAEQRSVHRRQKQREDARSRRPPLGLARQHGPPEQNPGPEKRDVLRRVQPFAR